MKKMLYFVFCCVRFIGIQLSRKEKGDKTVLSRATMFVR